jgi:hypothetical protein
LDTANNTLGSPIRLESQSSDHEIPRQLEHPGHLIGEHFTYDGIENPLQLLARASDLQDLSPEQSGIHAPTPESRHGLRSDSKVEAVKHFFSPIKASLDVDGKPNIEGFDPINVGLITVEEAEALVE